MQSYKEIDNITVKSTRGCINAREVARLVIGKFFSEVGSGPECVEYK